MLVADTLLAERTFLPHLPGTLVAADVEELVREEFHHLVDDILEEFEGSLLAWAHYDVLDSPDLARFVLTLLAAEPGIGSDGSHLMSRNLKLRDHVDMALRSVSHDVPDLVLSVVRAEAGELGIFLDLDAPALVLGQVEVHLVELEHRHHVELLLDPLRIAEVAAGIDVHAAVVEAGRVLDAHCGYRKVDAADHTVALSLRRQQLKYSLHAVEEAFTVAGSDPDGAAVGLDSITFLGNAAGRIYSKNDSIGSRRLSRNGQRLPGRSGYLFGE